ncbi:MAG: adenylate/guanylate cyclase domain-containing protein [Desulfobacterales bacterium]|jgi:adenylate cyclase|nr:adenylate/guanylate cyclase domain-containing protein [Desulfobacterales bacterium]
MEPKGFHRKLTAILSADVAGYSRLMQDDEAATVKTLEAYKQIISDLVKQHRGRVVDSPGDNLLAEFASVVDAVQCAVATQKELQARNTELSENRKMQFRIGVNLGDVIEEESRIYGDGVNIAARLESLADPGGICVSKTAFDQIETKLPFGYEFLGEQTVKNIAKPVGAYRVVLEPRVTKKKAAGLKQGAGRKIAIIGLAAALLVVAGVAFWQSFLRSAAPPPAPPVEKADTKAMALPLPDEPSIAVLPFVNMSDDPKQEFLCDGMAEAIITALSKVPAMFVIARNSTFVYKGKPVKAKQVSEELGVRYVLEGSLQRSADRLRITVQLIDALTGHHLWAERYDRDLKDIFALQDEITLKILHGVRVKLAGGDVSMAQKDADKYYQGKQGLDCYLRILEASGYSNRWSKEDCNLARQILEETIPMCPEIPSGYITLGWVYHHDYFLGNTTSPQETIDKGIAQAQKALAIDSKSSAGHRLLCALYSTKREYDKAHAEGEIAVALNPSDAAALALYAESLSFAGKREDAIPLLQKSLRLNPFASAGICNIFGWVLHHTGRYQEAASWFKKAIQRAPDFLYGHVGLAATYSKMGREEEAITEAAEILRIKPNFSLDFFNKTSALKDQSDKDRVIDALRKAGLK